MTPLAQTDAASSAAPSATSELRLLAQFLRGAVIIPAGLDWERLLGLASHHGVSGALGRALRSIDLPSPVRQQLLAAERRAAQHGLRLASILGEAAQALETAGIRVLAYKGPVLSQQLFGEPGVREAVDVDLLISPKEVRRAIDALINKGFVALRSYPPSSFPQLIAYRAEYGMTREDTLIELQWRLAPHYFTAPFEFESAWKNRELVKIGNWSISTLSCEDNLLALCVHGSKHHWEMLKWLLDLDLWLRQHPEVDVAAVSANAAALGLQRMLLASLATSHQLLETPLPGSWIHAIEANDEVRHLAQRFLDALGGNPPKGEFEHHRFMLRLRERARDRWLYMARLELLPTESEWDLVTLPRGLAWGYYALRLARVTGKAFGLLSSR